MLSVGQRVGQGQGGGGLGCAQGELHCLLPAGLLPAVPAELLTTTAGGDVDP